ncbi:hypothetical protein GUJ93_ZPchr0003g17850 [Zizania palustris]|uniref:Leucine-rich repeat-containing N-terminal plant-type domain-containing protein n=1 Tax=Zizania palustris TaxID=103762 RepID=A0A8J5SEQ7_ZIZPA|nr:hypothetical protein GUJ93_ZPchr0003g17850 [Zizania palustris]
MDMAAASDLYMAFDDVDVVAMDFLMWFLMVCVALLRIKGMIDVDIFDVLLHWEEGNSSPCSWLDVDCGVLG